MNLIKAQTKQQVKITDVILLTESTSLVQASNTQIIKWTTFEYMHIRIEHLYKLNTKPTIKDTGFKLNRHKIVLHAISMYNNNKNILWY